MRILSCKLNQQEQQKNDEVFKMGYIRVCFLLLWYTPLPKPTCEWKALFGLWFHITLYHWGKSSQEHKPGRNMKSWLIQRAWVNSAYGIVSQNLLNLPSYTTQFSCTFSHPYTMHYRFAYRQSKRGIFSTEILL